MMPLWKHQEDAVQFASERDACLLHCAMGSGKSRMVCELINRTKPERVLIVCPVSVLGVWRRELGKYCDNAEVLILDSGTVKEKNGRAFAFVTKLSDKSRVVVINYESAWREPLGKTATMINWNLLVADESHRAKSVSGKASRWLGRMRLSSRRRLCLTGTPMPHSPLDAFGQFRFLEPTIFGKSYITFRSRYAITNPMFPSQVTKWINQEELAEKIGSITFQCGDEMLDLPDAIHENRPVEMLPATMRVYRQLESELAAEWDGGVISVPNALVKLLRLQQITSGYIKPDDMAPVTLDRSKQDALEDILEDLPTTEPVVVFCRFTHDLAAVRESALRLGRRYGELSGNQKDLTPNATMPDDIDILGVQIASGGVGIDLTRAAYAVYYSVGLSLGEFEQSLARLRRPGQTRCVRYYYLTAAKTVDESIRQALEAKKEVVEYVLSQLKGASNGNGDRRSPQYVGRVAG